MQGSWTSDGQGVVSHAGSALLAGVADKTGLTRALSRELGALQLRAGSHDRGRVIRDLAVMLADGGDCLADLGAVRDKALLFGRVTLDATAFSVIDQIAGAPGMLDALRAAHATARARVWQLGGALERVTIDLDATLLTSHSDKKGAGYGFHPMLADCDFRAQLRLDRTRSSRARPHRLDPAPALIRRTRHRRTQTAALAPTAHRRPPRVPRPHRSAAPAAQLALGDRPRRRLPTPARTRATARLTGKRPREDQLVLGVTTPRDACPERHARHAVVPTNRRPPAPPQPPRHPSAPPHANSTTRPADS